MSTPRPVCRWLITVSAAGLIGIPVLVAAGAGEPADTPTTTPSSEQGIQIPAALLDAYTKAASNVSRTAHGCTGMRWTILAGIAQIETHHAAGHTISVSGQITPSIIGPRLDGTGTGGNHTPVHDTDHGRYDGDQEYDHAVGLMQFLPATWTDIARDGNADHTADPNNAYDAALTAAVYLCGNENVDLGQWTQLTAALRRYNHSDTYVTTVLHWIDTYNHSAEASTGNPDDAARVVINAALSQSGTPYAWGGGNAHGPTQGICDPAAGAPHDCHTTGYDCSGLVLYAYAQAGIALPHSSEAQYTAGTHIPRSGGLTALLPGDLVFYATHPQTAAGIHHVGIYLGAGNMINAPETGTTVRIDPVDLAQYAGAARLISPGHRGTRGPVDKTSDLISPAGGLHI